MYGQRRSSHRRSQLEKLEDRSLMAVISYWTGDNTALDSVGTNHGEIIFAKDKTVRFVSKDESIPLKKRTTTAEPTKD